jgi:O-antigen ligase
LSKFKPGRLSAVRPKAPRPSAKKQITGVVQAAGFASDGNGEAPEASQPIEETPNAFQRIGFLTTLLFVYFRFSFAHEFIAAKFHFNTHLIVLLGASSYLCCILSGHALRAFRERSTWLWCGFLGCMGFATALSFWRGGSFPLFVNYLETAFPIIFLLPAVTTTKSQLNKLISVIGLACVTTVFLGLFNDDFKSGRMNIDAVGSDIQDPNDYAAHLILMLPALAFFAMRAGRPIVLKLVGLVVFAFSFLQILSTGSRGGFLSLAITALYIAFIGSNKVKLGILAGVPLIGLLAVPFVPSQSAARLSTLFSSSSNPTSAEALESKEARLALLEQSGKATLEHPLLGVGPGIFMDYQAGSAKENGERAMWHVTHNSYTQVSSECGIPALILYICGLGTTFALLRTVAKSKDRELATIAMFISVMLVGFCICMFFLSLAYNVHILTLSAVAVALKQRLQADGELTSQENVSGLPITQPVHA